MNLPGQTGNEREGKCPGYQASWESLMESMEPERKAWMRSISNSSRLTFVEIRDSGRRPCFHRLPAGTGWKMGKNQIPGGVFYVRSKVGTMVKVISESR